MPFPHIGVLNMLPLIGALLPQVAGNVLDSLTKAFKGGEEKDVAELDNQQKPAPPLIPGDHELSAENDITY